MIVENKPQLQGNGQTINVTKTDSWHIDSVPVNNIHHVIMTMHWHPYNDSRTITITNAEDVTPPPTPNLVLLTINGAYAPWAGGGRIKYNDTDESLVQAAKAYQVPAGATVKIYGKNETSRTLYIYENGGTSLGGTAMISNSSKGCSFVMPGSPITIELVNRSGYGVNIKSGSVKIEALN